MKLWADNYRAAMFQENSNFLASLAKWMLLVATLQNKKKLVYSRDKTMAIKSMYIPNETHKITSSVYSISGWNVLTLILINQPI